MQGIQEITAKARSLPEVENYFSGRAPADGLSIPANLLLFCHDFSYPKPVISSRFMLTVPLCEMTYVVEGEPLALRPGRVLSVPPYLRRSVPDGHDDYLRLLISFEVEPGQDYLPALGERALTPKALTLLELLLDHYRSEETAQSLLTLTLLLYELSGGGPKSAEREFSAPVRQALLRINQFLPRHFTIQEVARESGLSSSHLRRVFREEVGVSLGEYMARHRLAAARRLLCETTHSVSAIARQCGYDSIYSFSRFFKDQTGLSPSAFRKAPVTEG